ncbi:MAG: hypothetical protein ACHQFZ_00235 [Acidimicrobiales bacterium]
MVLALSALAAREASSSSSPFPSVIKTQLWHPGAGTMGPKVAFGASVDTSTSGSRLCENVSVAGVQWSVWCDQAAQFPVVSSDGGRHWRVAGPLIANDWAGGSLFYVSKVTAFSPDVVAMTGVGVIDTTFDGGRTWHQLATSLSMAGAWRMSIVRFEGGTGARPYEPVLHIVENDTGRPLAHWSATYITLNRGRSWIRLSELQR